MACDHLFAPHVGLLTSFGCTAWVDERFVDRPKHQTITPPVMFRCTKCGEQGYEVPA